MRRKSICRLGDCLNELPKLCDRSVQAVITSPPYAEQRKHQYGGISEQEYPAWTVEWMEALRPKLTRNGSVLIVIAPHVRNGQTSDYVLRTRLALREAGWLEHIEYVWHKPDAPPLARNDWPRRTWESVLWYSRTQNPFIDVRSEQRISHNIGWFGDDRFGTGKLIHGPRSHIRRSGVARDTDIITAHVCRNARGVAHPAMFPQPLAEQLILRFTRLGDMVCDPFLGSGTTGLAAKALSRSFVGIERYRRYFGIAQRRLRYA
jgi:site-specific DNA-methyltransferase (adenine-specific)/site-specific DNA-methyltransferase (cytosine-N4-specific)